MGATLAFLASRFLLRDWVQDKFGDRLAAVNKGIEKEGGFYLFTLRLVPAFPFFVINLLMGLTTLRTWTFYWVSQLGMLAGTVVFVNAGTQLAAIESLRGILSPGLIVSFVLLGLFPLIAKKVIDGVKARKVYAKWTKPAKYDRNIVVIGAGSAGLVTSYIAAAVKAKVTLVERHQMGGDCLNTGCVPSKALIRSAKLLNHIQRSKEFGITSASAQWDFAEVMERVQQSHQGHRAARLGGALHVARRGVHCGHCEYSQSVGSRNHSCGWQQADADHQEHRHRHRRATVRAADSRIGRGRPAHIRQRVESSQAAETPRGAGWRPDRLRTDAMLRAFRLRR